VPVLLPQNVAVNDVLRYAMYYEHYGMEKRPSVLADLEPERNRPAAPPRRTLRGLPVRIAGQAAAPQAHDILTV
jgi:hypothetical protein